MRGSLFLCVLAPCLGCPIHEDVFQECCPDLTKLNQQQCAQEGVAEGAVVRTQTAGFYSWLPSLPAVSFGLRD